MQPAFLDQDHCRDGGDWLRHRGDPEDRVAPHRDLTVDRQRPDRIHVDLAVAGDQRHEARELAVVDVAGEHVAHAVEPGGRELAAG